MDSVNYDDFKNICRVCLLNCEDTFLLDFVISKIYNLLSGFDFNANDELPQQICHNCFKKFVEINAFSLQCKEAHSVLMKCLNKYKIEGLKEEQNIIDDTSELMKIKDNSSKFVKSELNLAEDNINQDDLNEDKSAINEYIESSEITIEEHKLEFVEDTYVFMDQLDIKPEINNYSNENSVQDDFNEIVVKEKVSHENTDQNDLNIPTHSGERSYECEICNKSCKRLNDLKVHKRTHRGERPYVCDICNKAFARSSNLIIHKRVHSGERSYTCDICNKSFRQLRVLKNHKLVHNDERPHECDVCNKTFARLNYLKVHKRIHSGERPYSCEICNKTFSHSFTFTKHKYIHTGERPYVCDICSVTFTDSSTLKNHKVIHSDERPYECETCNKTFKQLGYLRAHTRNCRMVHYNPKFLEYVVQ